MKKIFIFSLIIFSVTSIFAQNDVQYTQFFFNKLAFNPAYAGSREALTLGASYRHQWEGIAGAPRTMTAYAHFPFINKRQGAGLSITADKVGKVNTINVDLSYAYRIPVGDKGNIGLGLTGRVEHGRIDWTKAEINDAGDTRIPDAGESFTIPNFGAGIYYSNPNLYVGFSAPQLLKNTLYKNDFYQGRNISDLRSYYLMGGVTTKLSSQVIFRPSVMLSYNPNAPFEIDMNASFIFMKALWLGASYRLGDSVDGIVQYQFSPQFKAGVAVDLTLSELQSYTTGTFEFLMEYTFWFNNEQLQHLRFF